MMTVDPLVSPVVTRRDEDGVAFMTINNPPVNALSRAVRISLLKNIESIAGDVGIKAVVISGAAGIFIAGADIKEFDGPALEPSLPDVLDAIERSSKPVIAAIGGAALGGGAELALACHYRCMARDARIGLPEVKLGVIPGAGGIPRLVRLAGPVVTMELVASGRPISASTAHQAGIVDRTVDAARVVEIAAVCALELVGAPTRRTSDLDIPCFEQKDVDVAATRWLARSKGQDSIAAVVKAVVLASDQPFVEVHRTLREVFLSLRQSSQAAALRYLFFAERAARQIPDIDAKQALRPTSIAVIGAGTMGRGIAVAGMIAGYKTLLVDVSEEAITRGIAIIRPTVERSLRYNGRPMEELPAVMALLSTSCTVLDIHQSDLIIEAVFEDIDVKTRALAEIAANVAATAIICTNTSYIDIELLAAAVSGPERFIGMHFFAPAEIMKLVEIVRTARSSRSAIGTGVKFAQSLTKVPVLAGVCDGFIVNRILAAYRGEMEILLEEGAFPQDIDRVMEKFGMAMGPFAVADLSGLDIAWARRKRLAADRKPWDRYVEIADRLCEAGRLGMKAGRGWYRYVDGERQVDPEVSRIVINASRERDVERREISEDEIARRAIAAMVAEARAILGEGIALRPSDIDIAVVNGLGFPGWRGGPLYYAEQKDHG